MKAISSAIIVFSGTQALIASCNSVQINREVLFSVGVILILTGAAMWLASLRLEK